MIEEHLNSVSWCGNIEADNIEIESQRSKDNDIIIRENNIV